MKPGTIAKNENGVVGVITGREFYEADEVNNTYKKIGGHPVFVAKVTTKVTKRKCYTGVEFLTGKPWEGKEITPLTTDQLAGLQ